MIHFYMNGYILDTKQLEELNKIKDLKIVFDFENYSYVLECSGIYDWDKD